jgi:hypothetical protein
METESREHESLEGLVARDDDAIGRSLELLLADLSESNHPFNVDRDMDLEVERTPTNNIQEESKEDEGEEEIPRIEGDILDGVMPPPIPSYRVQVVVPEIPLEERAQYSFVHSDIVESVLGGALHVKHTTDYRVEFTDGREELVGGHAFIQTVPFACGPFSRASIVSVPEIHFLLLSRSVRFRRGGLNSAAIVYSLPYSLPTSQIYTPLLFSPAPLLLISRPSSA